MIQIVKNYLFIFIIPFALGAIVRFLIRKKSKAWILTAVCTAASVVLGIATAFVDTKGDEGLGLCFIQSVCLTAGSLAAAIAVKAGRRFRRKQNKNKK